LILPIDSIIADRFDNNANKKIAKNDAIPDEWMG
jgi:phosphoglycerate kinase